MKFLKIIITLILGLPAFSCQAQKEFLYGFNGHPLTQGAYSENFEKQFDFLKEVNASAYRIDLGLDITGKILKEDKLKEILKLSAESNVKIIPVLIFPEKLKIFELENPYDVAYKFGRAFAGLYGKLFEVIEVGNEQDNKIILGSNFSGESRKHYDSAKTPKMMQFMKGITEGLKSVKPDIKLIVDFCFVHFGFLDLLNDYKVRYDILGWHWYSNMGNLYSFGNEKINILNLLKKYDHKIWLTEFNVFPRLGSEALNKEDRLWLLQNLALIRKDPNVGALFVYELFDQPDFKTVNPKEAHFGVIRWKNKYDGFSRKQEYFVFKNIFTDRKNDN